MKIFDQIWARLVKVGGFLMGMFIMYHEAFADKGQKPYLYAAAIAMMGLQIAETLEKFFAVVGSITEGIGKSSSTKDSAKDSSE